MTMSQYNDLRISKESYCRRFDIHILGVQISSDKKIYDIWRCCYISYLFRFLLVLDTESWHLLSGGSSSHNVPPPRHKHSAVLHSESMWIFGGMTDLQERQDLWRWDLVAKRWIYIKTKIQPGPLHSHAACKIPSGMLIFGGERNGLLVDEVWRFSFGK